MNGLKRRLLKFLASDDGPTACEYACMCALVIVVAIVSIQAVGNQVNQTMTTAAIAVSPNP